MKYNGVILKRFTILDSEVAKLESLQNLTTDILDNDHFLKHGIERALQICVEIIIDVSQRILYLEGRQPAATSFDALKGLETLNIISSAKRYHEMIQFRNFVVHRYERVDSGILISILNNRLDDFSSFRNEVAGAL